MSLVRIVSDCLSCSCRASARQSGPENSMMVSPSITRRAAVAAISCISSRCTALPSRSVNWLSGSGESPASSSMRTAPPWVRTRSPFFSIFSRSRRMVTSDTSRSSLKACTSTCFFSSRYLSMKRYRSSANKGNPPYGYTIHSKSNIGQHE